MSAYKQAAPPGLLSTPYIGVEVEIVRDAEKDEAKVIVHARLYMQKIWTMWHSYRATHFTNEAILQDRDFQSVLARHYAD